MHTIAGVAPRFLIFALFILFCLVSLTGCADETKMAAADRDKADSGSMAGEKLTVLQPSSSSEGKENGRTSKNLMRITVYHATDDAMFLAPVEHVVPLDNHPAQTALDILLAGTQKPKLVSVMPSGTKLRGISIKDHIAFVDFNDRLIRGNNGGSIPEILIVGAIVNTLTEFPEIHAVQILVNGEKVNTLTGHLDISEPVSRAEKIIKR